MPEDSCGWLVKNSPTAALFRLALDVCCSSCFKFVGSPSPGPSPGGFDSLPCSKDLITEDPGIWRASQVTNKFSYPFPPPGIRGLIKGPCWDLILDVIWISCSFSSLMRGEDLTGILGSVGLHAQSSSLSLALLDQCKPLSNRWPFWLKLICLS